MLLYVTCKSESILVFLVAGEQQVWAQVFGGELFPGWREILLLVSILHLNLQQHLEKLRILVWRIARIQLRPEHTCEYLLDKAEKV